MSQFKCKMCGGTLEIQSGSTVAECEYCGAKQTLPKLDDEKRANLYDRANHFRRSNEFDKATAIYEQILNEDGTDAEAYWSLVLCHYGIEYVEDPLSHRRVPTVHRAQFTSIFDDDNYKMALKNADSYQRIIYEEEAKAWDVLFPSKNEISRLISKNADVGDFVNSKALSELCDRRTGNFINPTFLSMLDLKLKEFGYSIVDESMKLGVPQNVIMQHVNYYYDNVAIMIENVKQSEMRFYESRYGLKGKVLDESTSYADENAKECYDFVDGAIQRYYEANPKIAPTENGPSMQ